MEKLNNNSNTNKSILIFIYLLIIIIPLFTYWNSINIPLISDDFVCMKDLSSWGFDGGKKSFFRPFIKFYFESLIPVIGQNAKIFHFLNIIIHITTVLLLFNLINILLQTGINSNLPKRNNTVLAGVLSLNFALLYSGSEAVFWISGITSLFQSFFIILIIYFYLLFLVKKKYIYLYFSYIAFIIGLGAKEGVFLIIALIPLFYFLHTANIRITKTMISWIPYWAIGIGYFIVASRVFDKAEKGGGYTFRFGFTLFRNIQQFFYSTLLMTPYNDGSIVTLEKKILSIPIKPRHVVELDLWVFIGFFSAIMLLYIFFSGKLSTKSGFAMILVVLLPLSLPKKHLSGWGAYPYSLRTYYLPALIFVLILAIYFKDIILEKKKKTFILILTILIIATIINGVRIQQRSFEWITAGKRYNVILRRINKKLNYVNKGTRNVQIRIVDPTDDKGLHLHYIFPLSVDYKHLRIIEKKFSNIKGALRLSSKEKNRIASGRLQVIVYNDFNTRFISK